jgi:putative membrane protein
MTRTILIGVVGILLSMGRAWAGDFKAEIDFLTRASGADVMAIAESQLALARARDPQVKAFARRLLDAHQTSAAELKAAAIGSGASPATKLDHSQQALVAALGVKSGPAFDKAYVADQLAVHSNALTLYADYMLWGENAKLNALAVKMIPITEGQLKEAVGLEGE